MWKTTPEHSYGGRNGNKIRLFHICKRTQCWHLMRLFCEICRLSFKKDPSNKICNSLSTCSRLSCLWDGSPTHVPAAGYTSWQSRFGRDATRVAWNLTEMCVKGTCVYNKHSLLARVPDKHTLLTVVCLPCAFLVFSSPDYMQPSNKSMHAIPSIPDPLTSISRLPPAPTSFCLGS